MGLKKYFGTLLSDGRVEIRIPDSWRVVLSKIVGRVPTVDQLDHDTIAKNARTGTLYVLKESEAGVKEVVEIGGSSGPDPNSHTRLHSMTDPLDHAAAAEADRGKALGNNSVTGAPEWFQRPVNYWTRTGTTLSQATAGDKIEVVVTGSDNGVKASASAGDAIRGEASGGGRGGYFSATGSANAVQGFGSGSGSGGYFVSSSGNGVSGVSSSGPGGSFYSGSNHAVIANVNPKSTNTIVPAARYFRSTVNTAQSGIGVSVEYSLETDSGSAQVAGLESIVFVDAGASTFTSEYNIQLRKNGAALSDALKVKATGETKALGLYPFPIAIFRQTADKTIANTTTETTMFGTGQGSLTIPANRLEAGTTIRIKMQGYIDTPASDENATFKVKFGSTELISIAGNLPQSLSDAAVVVDLMMTCRSSGATGKMMAAGVVLIEIRGAGYNAMIRLQNTAEVTVDTTSASAVDVTFKWNAAKEANQLITNVSTVELI